MVAWRNRRDQPETATARARAFRREMSAGEARLWRALRGKRFEGLKFRRQVPVGPYIADFYCDAHKLIVEVDGGQHQFDRQAAHDAERDAYLRAQGYRVLRISQLTVLNDIGAAFAHIRALLGIAPE